MKPRIELTDRPAYKLLLPASVSEELVADYIGCDACCIVGNGMECSKMAPLRMKLR